MCSITIIYLPNSATYCCYTALGNIGCGSKGLTATRGCTKLMPYVSLLGCTSLIFVNPNTKIDGWYYRDVVLMQQVLPSIRSSAGDAYVFQQDSAPAQRARQTKFIASDLWPPNSRDLNPVDYRI